jgi:hypothetical protein
LKILVKKNSEELEVDEPILQSPHVTLSGLSTSLYVLHNSICVRRKNTYIKFEYVNQSIYIEFEYVFGVMRSKIIVRKSKVRI